VRPGRILTVENDAATATHVSAGRPRDPEVNRRITQAALDLFGQAGWAGFAMEAVARRAGVGKASVYLRWSTKEALLTEAVTRRLTRVTDADTGTLRGDLTELAVQMLELYAGPDSQAVLRLHVEAAAIPGVAEHYAAVRRSQVLAARAIVRRGIRRGELTAATPVTLLLDTLAGGAMMHVLSTPPDLKAGLARDIRTYAQHLVRFLLGAVAAAALPALVPGRGQRQRHLDLAGPDGHVFSHATHQFQRDDARRAVQPDTGHGPGHRHHRADEVELAHPEAADRPDRPGVPDPVPDGPLPRPHQEERAGIGVRRVGRHRVGTVVVDRVEVPVAAGRHDKPVQRQGELHRADGVADRHVAVNALAAGALAGFPAAGEGCFLRCRHPSPHSALYCAS
jgi:AcrR family transcriptional regulator